MSSPEQSLEQELQAVMLDSYETAKHLKPPYNAYAFLRMVNEHGGRETVNRLLATGDPSEGFTQLFMRGPENLRLSVEFLVLKKRFRPLFSEEQLAVARKRLVEYECPLPTDDER
jgi:hypothetical protein